MAGLALAVVIVVTALADEAARRHLVPASDGMDAQTTYERALVVLAFVAAGYVTLVAVVVRELRLRLRRRAARRDGIT